jgi:hypothetical protein
VRVRGSAPQGSRAHPSLGRFTRAAGRSGVEQVSLPRDATSGEPLGFGFIKFHQAEPAASLLLEEERRPGELHSTELGAGVTVGPAYKHDPVPQQPTTGAVGIIPSSLPSCNARTGPPPPQRPVVDCSTSLPVEAVLTTHQTAPHALHEEANANYSMYGGYAVLRGATLASSGGGVFAERRYASGSAASTSSAGMLRV